MPFKKIRVGLLLLFPMLFGTACTALPPKQQPPAELLADCPEPLPPTERSNAGLARSVLDYRHALTECNADKAALREFFK